MPELIKSTPRLKAVPMAANPEMLIGVSEKGGISIYGLQRFPVTLYREQWERLLTLDVVDELNAFIETNASLLSDGKPESNPKGKPDEGYTINQSDIAVLDVAVAQATAANDAPAAIKYATIKQVAVLNKNRVSPEAMLEIMTLKARK